MTSFDKDQPNEGTRWRRFVDFIPKLVLLTDIGILPKSVNDEITVESSRCVSKHSALCV